jgi:CHAT domain-containing protein/tetratricopeptide (TPR) repeat protein
VCRPFSEDAVQQSALRGLIRTRSVLAGATVVIAAGVLLYAVSGRSPSPHRGASRPDLQELVVAVGQRRTFEPRVTGNFAYGTLVASAPARSAGPSPDAAPLELRVAAIALEKRARTSADPLALNAFGIAQLVTGQTAGAVSTLEEAIRLAPKDARLSSDMAAGYLVRARETDRIDDVARAVGFAEQATELDPKLAEARFNLALSLERLSLRREATRVWQSYLALDAASEWAAEARRRLEQLAETPEARWEKQRREIIAAGDRGDETSIRAATGRFPDTAYEYVENDLIPAWADGWLARDGAKAASSLKRAWLYGQALADGVGDRMALDAVLAIERASKNQQRADRLASGHQLFREARSLVDQDRIAQASDVFKRAQPRLAQARSPFADWTALYLAVATFYRGDLEASGKTLDALLEAPTSRAHLVLAARAHRVRGLIYNLTSRPAEALASYRRALSNFTQAGTREEIAAIQAIIAETIEQSGDYRTAWSHWQLALGGLPSTRTPRRRQTILNTAAITTQQARLLRASLQFRNELFADALESRRAGPIVAALTGRADVHHLLGKEEMALADIGAAEEWLSRIPDADLADRERAEASLVEGELFQQSHPERALRALNESLAYFTKSRMSRRLPRIALAMGRAQHHAGRDDAAEASFLLGIGELERYRQELPARELRLAYFEQPWSIFDEMVALQIAGGKAGEALTFAERARARDLLDTASRSPSPGLIDPSQLARDLPASSVMLYYASLERELLIWRIGSGRVELFRQPTTSSELARLIDAFLDGLQSPHAEQISRESELLFDRIVGPVEKSLPHETDLIIVPDGALHKLPFAALKNRATGRYLVEDHVITVAPSATMFHRAAKTLRRLPGTHLRGVLAIGNPKLDPADSDAMSNLAGAEAEARDLATLYPDTLVLTRTDATKQAFLDKAGRFGIVHFGGHALANERYPLMSRLLLARDEDGRSGSLFAHEVLDLAFPRTTLLVLAACRTAAGPVIKGEGPISVARPFLAAGIPSVLATLWDVGDAPSQEFFRVFYRSLRTGMQPVEALRTAQVALLTSDDASLKDPAAWAGFVAMGGMKLEGDR